MHNSACWKYGAALVAVLCLVFVSALNLRAQGTTSNITGVVTDQSGAVIPGAKVTVTNQATGASLDLTTNSAGIYRATSVPAGSYTIKVSAKGFQTYEAHDSVVVVDQTLRLDVTLQVGAETQMVTVESAAPLVSTEEGRLTSTVTGSIVQNMPLNGRNVYQLMLLIPGAVASMQVDFEANAGGIQTNINGTRANFNGFLLDGVSNKGLSGGSNSQPAPDFVQEFSIQTNNFDAEYGNSAGSITNVAVKSGTNQFHGDAWEYFRNDKLNARNFFDGATKAEWRMNQFGASVGGPIKKDKIFFFGGFEGERFRTATPSQVFVESTAFRQAVESANPNSVAALLYSKFRQLEPDPATGSTTTDIVNTNAVNEFGAPPLYDGTNAADAAYGTDASSNPAGFLTDYYMNYLDPCYLANFVGVGLPTTGGPNWGNPQTAAQQFATLFGITSQEQTQIASNIATVSGCSGFTVPTGPGATALRSMIMEGTANASAATRTRGVFYDGNQYVARLDYQGDTNRMFGRFYYTEHRDPNTNPVNGIRGFPTPFAAVYPGGAYGWVHTFSPTIVNEFRAGYTRNATSIIPNKDIFGVPQASFDTGEPFFGAYNGYPQFFYEDVFNFKDMVSMVKGKHALKIGAELKKNYENSEFNVGRPSYYFFDPFYFSVDLPYYQAAGVNPELTGVGGSGSSHLDTNIRAWRNYEVGLFIQDDWKVHKNLTLNIGVRWDYYSPHTEKYNKATEFILPPGSNPEASLAAVNCQAFSGTSCLAPAGDTQTPNGGFAPAKSLFASRYGNIGPRIGFSWDPFGKGKTSVRGGFAISYESSFYNALSNSRWNLPFYSFNEACPICGVTAFPTYGPHDASGNPTGATPTFTGPPANIGQGPAGLGFTGNIMGWLPSNVNLATLTGIPNQNYQFPYYESYFLGFQHQLSNSTVVEVNGVSTLGKHLFWAEDPNRVVGGKLRDPSTVIDPCTGAAAESATGLVNTCFGHMRTWETSVDSSYFGLQASLNRKFSRGLAFTSAYTWSHSLDFRSTWHSLSSGGSATDANARGEAGYSTDPTRIYLEHGNSLFDVRQRWVSSLQWDMPWMKAMQGARGKVLGGWSTQWIVQFQSGFPFTVGATKDYNLDGTRSDRPNAPSFGNHMSFTSFDFEEGSGSGSFKSKMASIKPDFTAPTCTAPGSITCDGTLGRNTFRGPGINEFDFSLFKKIPLGSESRYLQFRAEIFNLFNHTNLNPPDANLSSGQFGLSTEALDPREVQFGLKLFF